MYEVVEAIAGRLPLAIWNGESQYDAWKTLGDLVAADINEHWFALVVCVTNPEPGIVCRMTLEVRDALNGVATKQWSIRKRG
jgi:hypothetical protein